MTQPGDSVQPLGHAPPHHGPGVKLHRRFDRNTLRQVRHEVRDCLLAVGLPSSKADEFTFAINEGLINAIMHGGGGGEVIVERADDHVSAIVEDRRPTEPFPLPEGLPPPSSLGGRGLWLVTRSADSARLERGTRGLRLIMTMSLR